MTWFQRLTDWFMPRKDAETRTSQLNDLINKAQRTHYAEDYDEAIALLNEASELAKDQHNATARVDIDLSRGDILIAQGRYDEAESWLTTLKEDVESKQHKAPLAYALCSLGQIDQARGNPNGARRQYERARQIAVGVGADGAAGRASGHLADVYLAENNASYARRLLEEAVQQLQSSGDRELLGYFQARLGQTLLQLGHESDGREMLQQGLKTAQLLQHRAQMRDITQLLGAAALHQHDYHTANDYYAATAKLYPDENTPPHSAEWVTLHTQWSIAQRHLGEIDTAITTAQKALQGAEALDNAALIAQANAAAGLALATNDDASAAQPYLDAALTAYENSRPDATYIALLRSRAATLAHDDDDDTAQDIYQQAVSAAQNLPLAQAQVYDDLAEFHMARQQWQNARTALQQALDSYAKASQTQHAARLYATMGNAHLYRDEIKQALKHYDTALAHLDNGDDPSVRGSILADVGLAYTDYGDLDAAENYLTEALQLAQTHSPADTIAERHGRYAYLLALTNRADDALTQLDAALEATLSPAQQAILMYYRGVAHAADNQYDDAVQHQQQALETLPDDVPSQQRQRIQVHLAEALYQQGDADAARRLYEAVLTYDTPFRLAEVAARVGLAQLALDAGALDDAGDALEAAYQQAKRARLRREMVAIYEVQRQLYMEKGETAKAQAAQREANRLRQALQMPPQELP